MVAAAPRFLVSVTQDGPNDGGDFGPNTPGTMTSGIQEAIAALAPGRVTQGTVAIYGEHEVMQAVLVPSYTRCTNYGTVRAAANAAIPAGYGVFINAGAPSPSSQDYDIEIAGGIVDGNMAHNATAFEGVVLDGVIGGVVRQVEVQNAPENGIGAGAPNGLPTSVDVVACIAHDCAQFGIVADDGGRVRVTGGESYGNATGLEIVNDDGSLDTSGADIAVGGGFRAHHNRAAGITVESQGGAAPPQNLTIAATVDHNGQFGLQVLGGSHLDLDVTAQYNGFSGAIISGAHNVRGHVTAYDNAQAADANFEHRAGVLVRSSSDISLDVDAGDEQATPTQAYGLGLEANLPDDLAHSTFYVRGSGNSADGFAAYPNTGTFADSITVVRGAPQPVPSGGIVIPALLLIGAGALMFLARGRG